MTDVKLQADDVAQFTAVMGNTQLVEQFARDKGWTDEQAAELAANMANPRYLDTLLAPKEE